MGTDPFVKTWWFLEAHDGSWLADRDHELFTRDPNAALKWPNETRAHDTRLGLHLSLGGKIKAITEHNWVEPPDQSVGAADDAAQVEGEGSRDELLSRLTQAREALARLRTAAALLQANAEGCAVHHYGEDFGLHGMPGWLVDTAKDIESAAAALAGSGEKSAVCPGIAQLIADVEAVPPYARLDLTPSKTAAFVALTKGEWARIKAALVPARPTAEIPADGDEGTAQTIAATQVVVGTGMADIGDFQFDDRRGVLIRPRQNHIPLGEPGELQDTVYWTVPGDVVIWVDGPPDVLIEMLTGARPAEARSSSPEGEA